MKKEINCPICNNLCVPKRGYCNTCYARLLRTGELKKIEKIIYDIDISSKIIEVITGHMLGDGCLYKNKPQHLPYFTCLRTESDFGYNIWTASLLSNLVLHADKRIVTFDKRTNKEYRSSKLITVRTDKLNPLYNLWYPNGKKHLPTDLIFTSLILAVWFADDGWMGPVSSKGMKNEKWRMSLATDGFTHTEASHLSQLLTNRYNEPFNVNKNGSGFRISASDKASRLFAEDINPIFPEGMNRKAYWRNYGTC